MRRGPHGAGSRREWWQGEQQCYAQRDGVSPNCHATRAGAVLCGSCWKAMDPEQRETYKTFPGGADRKGLQSKYRWCATRECWWWVPKADGTQYCEQCRKKTTNNLETEDDDAEEAPMPNEKAKNEPTWGQHSPQSVPRFAFAGRAR